MKTRRMLYREVLLFARTRKIEIGREFTDVLTRLGRQRENDAQIESIVVVQSIRDQTVPGTSYHHATGGIVEWWSVHVSAHDVGELLDGDLCAQLHVGSVQLHVRLEGGEVALSGQVRALVVLETAHIGGVARGEAQKHP